MAKKKINERTHKLEILIKDKNSPIFDELGNVIDHKNVWVEVNEANLGSYRNPNREILMVRFEPLVFHDEERDNVDPFRWFRPGF